MALARRLLLRVWGLMALGVLVVAVFLVRAEVITATAVLLYGGVFLLLMLYLVWFEWPRQTWQQNAHKLGRPTAYRIDDAGIHMTAGFDTETVPWAVITGVARTRGQIVIWQGWRKASGVPSGELSAVEQRRLLEVLHSRGRALTDAGSPR
jgi:hypothetical protein